MGYVDGHSSYRLDLNLYTNHNLRSEAALDTALTHFNQVLNNEHDSEPLESVVEKLLSIDNLFPFIVSQTASSGDNVFVSRILEVFPTSADGYLGSITSKLLNSLSLYLFSLSPHLFSTGQSRDIGHYRTVVEGTESVLRTISSMDFTQIHAPPPEEDDIPIEGFEDFAIIKKSQKNRKKKRPKVKVPATDFTPFFQLGLKAPNTPEESQGLVVDILSDRKQILQFYLVTMSDPDLTDTIKSRYIVEDDSEFQQVTNAVDDAAGDVAVQEARGAFPSVQPMKAALYFDNAEGFGEWTILVGNGADRKLREFRKADVKIFSIIVKKIKQLSNGHFSDDNQKPLNGPESGVPIFEAKMTRDLRLVYQVDCIPEHDGELERQVIKIYGIYTHAQLDHRLWDAMGYQLSGKGKEYKRRCKFRNRPVNPGDNVILPASFPPEVAIDESPVDALKLRDKDLHELHALLVLEKYVTFSQAFLNSIVADRDVTHVFHLTPPERQIVECTSSCYVLGRSGTGKTTTMLFKMLGIQRAWEIHANDMPKPRQIFVTKSKVLATKVEEYFAKLLESLALAGHTVKELATVATKDSEMALVDVDDVPEWHSDIPLKFSLLEDKHFPLFLTFERLSNMVKADLDDFSAKSSDDDYYDHNMSPDGAREGPLVSYETFLKSYWPHFPQPLTKNLDPWLVFSEFIGIIKGSEQTLGCDQGFLDPLAYGKLSHRTRSTFATQRDTIYSIFGLYCKLKRQNRQQDIADRTHSILKSLLGKNTFPGQKIDYLYVDEAQDNLLIDALLLRLLCRNPDGLFWAGDTAQTISAGSSFRFDDLKAFLYRIEHEGVYMIDCLRAAQEPQSFQLAINYRSHGGIVNCAHSVIDLITRFWPNAIDVLAPEKGVVDGLKPIFFTGWDQDTVRYEQFLFGNSGSHIEFGAQQCIIVRDDLARDKLKQQVGDIGLIMTLYESKGLEFNDVLLYNFFEDSAFDLAQWRIVLNAIDSAYFAGLRAPSFERDEARYAGICGELKLLYVGITRARKNMWIVDRSERCEPMRLFWDSREQVQICTPGTDVPHLAVSSTPEEWATFGRSLFQHKRYSQAMHCFERALLPREVTIAKTYHLREQARAMSGSIKHTQKAFLQVAVAFSDCAAIATGKEMLQYYYNAADCYVRAGDDRKAAEAYIEAREFGLAAKRYRKATLFPDTLRVLNLYGEHIPSNTLEELLNVCRLYYYSQDELQPPPSLFKSYDEALKFLEDYDLDVARVTLLESHGRYSEAAELHLLEGRPMDAIKSFLKDVHTIAAAKRASECLLDMLWQNLSFTVTSRTATDSNALGTLRSLVVQVKQLAIEDIIQDEISIFDAILSEDLATLEKLAIRFQDRHQAAVLLCLEHIFSRSLHIHAANVEEVSTLLRKFLVYIRLLYQLVSDMDPLSKTSMRKLLGISEISNNEYFVAQGTFLHICTQTRSVKFLTSTPAGITMSRTQLTEHMRTSLRGHLQQKVLEEDRLCQSAKAFSMCLTYSMSGQCNWERCRQSHVDRKTMDAKYYNARVGIHLQQISILQVMYSAEPNTNRERLCYWTGQLYEAFSPPFYVQGSMADYDSALIPESRDGIRIMKNWLRDLFLHSLDPLQNIFLTNFLRGANLSFMFDRSEVLKYIGQAKRSSSPLLFRKPNKIYIMDDIVSALQGNLQNSILSGVLFIRHIIQLGLNINLPVLCDCIDNISASLVICIRSRESPPLHDVVLPRSWLLMADKCLDDKDTYVIFEFFSVLEALLNILRSESARGFLFLDRTRLTSILCNLFISRLCRTLCLLGHNLFNTRVKSRVTKILALLEEKDPLRRPHPSYRRYAGLKVLSRDAFLRAIVHYQNYWQVSVNDLVHLVCEGKTASTWRAVEHVEKLTYANAEEIPSLLAKHLAAARSNLRPEAPAFVPVMGLQGQTQWGHIIGLTEGSNRDGTQTPIEDDDAAVVDDEAFPDGQEIQIDRVADRDSFAHAVDETMVQSNIPTEEETQAAGILQTIYRRRLDRRSRSARAALDEERHAFFEECLKQVKSTEWAPSYYRLLYLGPLPHLLLCLERAVAILHDTKRKIKGRLTKNNYDRLEELGKQRTELTALRRQGERLRKALEPKAPFHRKRDIEALKGYVLEMKVFLQKLPGGAPELQRDYDTAYKGIVQPKIIEKKAKPVLNMEDLYGI